MNIAGIFIRRPVMTTLVMFALLLFGLLGYRALPVSDLPNVDFPTILVTGVLPGASPETMASAVATPLERQFSTISGLNSMNSTSALGNTQITLQFDLDRNLDAAAQDVQTAITAASVQLPPNMPSPPTFKKVNPADQPILYLALGSPVLPLSQVDEYAETFLSQRISMISGVAQVQIFGSQKYAVRIRLNPDALSSRAIGIDEVVAAVQKANVNLPVGILSGPEQAYTIQATGQIYNAAAYRPIIVAYRNNAPVRLGELGSVIDSVENDKVASWYNNKPAIVLAIQRQPGTNTVRVVNEIKKLLPEFRAAMPASINLDIIYDRSDSIRSSVSDVELTLALAIVLVVLIIFLFLRNLRATIIPSLALPFSIVSTFAVMYFMNFSLDNLSLMSLTLAVGFIVDDAIVMLENIVRHTEGGEQPYEAALKGSGEINFTIVSMTMSLVAVFIPVLFMGGILGRLLHEFAVVISAAILISGLVSLSLTPMLCSRFLKRSGEVTHGRIFIASERLFARMLQGYEWSLKWALKFRFVLLAISMLLLFLTVYLFIIIPKGFIPNEDTGQLFIFTEVSQGVSFDSMAEHQTQLAHIIGQDPNVDAFMSAIGASGLSVASNTGRIFVRLKPHSERRLSADEVIQELRPKLSGVPGIRAFMQNLPPIRIGGMLTKSQYQFSLQSTNPGDLYRITPQFESRLRQLAGFQDVTSDMQVTNPQVTVEMDRDKVSALGLSPGQIEDALSSSYSSRQISTIYAPNNEYQVIVEVEPRYQRYPGDISQLYVRSTGGQLIPLDTIARITKGVGPLTVNHIGQLPAVTVSFNLSPGTSLGEAVTRVQDLARSVIPPSITTSLQGSAQAFQSSIQGLGLLLIIAVLVIYIILGILYESFVHPLTILSGLPAAGVGALLTLILFGMELNIYSFVGVILLIGIVKKNAIMMIDFALTAERDQGMKPADAIYQGCLIRFRPIMMTTFAALMATLPIALGFGAGAESRRPLGMAVVGGLIFSQLITLYITPVIYTFLDEMQARIPGRLKFLRRGKH